MRNTRRGGIVVSRVLSLVQFVILIPSKPFLEHKIYQMDYNRKTKEYRMLEHFKPKVRPFSAFPSPGLSPL